MKNLFRIDRTNDDLSGKWEATPFDEGRITPELEKQLDAVTADAIGGDGDKDQEIRAASRPDWRFWVGLGLMMAVIITALAAKDVVFASGTSYLSWALLIVLALSTVLISLSRRTQRRNIDNAFKEQSEVDFKAAMEKLDALSGEAREMLGIPDDALELDVFPYVFTCKNGAEKSVYRKGRFDQIPMLAWRRGSDLLLSDSRAVVSIPGDAVLGKQEYDEDFSLEIWLKGEECGKGRFKPYNLKKSGLMGCKGHTYYGVVLRAQTGDSFEVLVPDYDFCELEKLISLPDLSASSEN